MKNDINAKSRNARALEGLMQQFNLTRYDVCVILGRRPKRNGGSHGTVDNWLSGRHRMPMEALQVVTAKAPTYVRSEGSPKRIARPKEKKQ